MHRPSRKSSMVILRAGLARLQCVVFVAALGWPVVQLASSAAFGVSSWRLAGWGMYATPQVHMYRRIHVHDARLATCGNPRRLHTNLWVHGELTSFRPLPEQLRRALSLETLSGVDWGRLVPSGTAVVVTEEKTLATAAARPPVFRPYGTAAWLVLDSPSFLRARAFAAHCLEQAALPPL